MKKLLASLVVFLFFLTASFSIKPLLNFTTSVEAAVTAPDYTISYYMNTVDPDTLYDMGYAKGEEDRLASGAQDTLVILFLGAQTSNYGATLWYNPDVTTSEIEAGIEAYGRGYYIGTGYDTASRIRLVVSTNNSGSYVTYNAGKAWAEMINNIGAYLSENNYDSQVWVFGGNDIEGGWGAPSKAKNWVDGYDSVNNYLYYDTGDACGCSYDTSYDGKTVLNCDRVDGETWTINDVYYISYGASPALVIPQIYNESGKNAKQWKNISKYGNVTKGSFYIHGSITQQGACAQRGGCSGVNNSPAQGWTQLWNELDADSDTRQSTLPYSTDVSWHGE
ncbi:hypothetical protein [Thermicanus aegyptius]|uniref:hypothetical protein n=1 Tax=Thermicanus aegyptius TaxID=94009 RepID=UPI00041EBA74|nr:hypothetical protein [Thermicanus aegyptius]